MHKLCQITHNLEAIDLFAYKRHLPILNRLDEHRYDVSQVGILSPRGSKLVAACGQSLLDLPDLQVVRHEPLTAGAGLDAEQGLLIIDGELPPDLVVRSTAILRDLQAMPTLLLTALPKD